MKKFLADGCDNSMPPVRCEDSQSPCRSSSSSFIQPVDNIASILRRRAASSSLYNVDQMDIAKRLSRLQADENGKTSSILFHKAGSVQDVSGKPVSHGGCKASDSLPLARTQSFQSISQPISASVGFEAKAEVRRTSSSQMVASHIGSTRLSAPISATMAFNAELLSAFERERRALDHRISELIQVAECRRTESERLKIELRNNCNDLVAVEEECELLRRDNEAMRERLLELNVTVDHFTDSEKLSLLRLRRLNNRGSDVDDYKCQSVSDSGEAQREVDGEAALSAGSLDGNWDRGSEGALTVGSESEVSVACLQDRLLAMEETQYSTSEELAATLQELTDLQDAVNSLTLENERLADERAIVLESLCAQTQKLENARRQIEYLKALLLRDSNVVERSENERQMAALLHGAEEEREELLLKQVELNNAVASLNAERVDLRDTTYSLTDKIQALELQVSALMMEKNALSAKLGDVKSAYCVEGDEQKNGEQLDNGDEHCNQTIDTGMECKHCARLELTLSTVREELATVRDENSALRGRVTSAEDEAVQAKSSTDLLAAEMDQRLETAERQVVQTRGYVESLRADNARLNEENKVAISKLESELRLARMRAADAEKQVLELSERLENEHTEWKNFQRDLQTAVCVAVDIRTEAELGAERLLSENRALRDQELASRREVDSLQSELSRLRTAQKLNDENTGRDMIRDRVINTVDRELTLLRQQSRRVSDVSLPSTATANSSQPSLSVRRLISSIEEQVKAEPSADSLSRHDFPDLVPKSSPNVSRQDASCSSESSVERPVVRRTLQSRVASGSKTSSECSGAANYRHTIDGSLLSATDETKCAVAELAAATATGVAAEDSSRDSVNDGTRKPRSGILSNKLTRRKTSAG